MSFTSFPFIFIFLPITVTVYFAFSSINTQYGKLFLTAASFFFIFTASFESFAVMLLSIAFNWVMSRIIVKQSLGSIKAALNVKKTVMITAIVVDITTIFYFKYINFAINTFNQIFSSDFLTLNVILPLGISFYIIQQIGFIIDSYKGETDNVSILDYLLFVSFFPQLVQGPILLHDEIIPQFKDKARYHVNYDNLSIGIMLILGGGGKETYHS